MTKYLLLSIILFLSSGSNLCISTNQSSTSQKNMKTDIKELAQRSKINFDENCRIIFQEDNLGGHQESQGWIVFSPKKLDLPAGELGQREGDDAKDYLSQFQKTVRGEDFGKLVSDKTYLSSWESGWDAVVIQTDKGFYTDLEWVKQQ